jgi:predicted site-specific integrase-resolvase
MANSPESTDSAIPDLLTPREVCDRLRISAATLRTWDQHLAPVKLPSGHRRYRRTDVEAIERGEVPA